MSLMLLITSVENGIGLMSNTQTYIGLNEEIEIGEFCLEAMEHMSRDSTTGAHHLSWSYLNTDKTVSFYEITVSRQ